jgi:hypothetical protein
VQSLRGGVRARVANQPPTAFFFMQKAWLIFRLDEFVRLHIFRRFARPHVARMHCQRRCSIVALQKYSYLGNLPPLVIRLRVNVKRAAPFQRQFQRNPAYISISMLSFLKVLKRRFVFQVFNRTHAIASAS